MSFSPEMFIFWKFCPQQCENNSRYSVIMLTGIMSKRSRNRTFPDKAITPIFKIRYFSEQNQSPWKYYIYIYIYIGTVNTLPLPLKRIFKLYRVNYVSANIVASLQFTRCAKRQRKRNKNTIGSLCASSSHQNNFQWISPIGVRVAHWLQIANCLVMFSKR